MYKGVYSYPDIAGSTEAMHSALGASIYRFSNDGLHVEAKIVDPKKISLRDFFVAT